MIQELIKSFFLIFMAEMGDKTQILALAFATQFKVQKVLLGVLIGVLLNHAIAVLLGMYLSRLITLNIIQVIAGFTFILFSLWTLRADNGDEDGDKEVVKRKLGPVLTVAAAFFIGELGDKTQLTAITLSVDSRFPLFVLMGTVLGMVLISGIGIFVGSKLGSKIPEFGIKITAAVIFMVFGLEKLLASINKEIITAPNVTLFLLLLSVFVYFTLKESLRVHKKGKTTVLQQQADILFEYYHKLNKDIKKICLGEAYCVQCMGKDCIIGYTKILLNNVLNKKEDLDMIDYEVFSKSLTKNFNKDKIIECLALTLFFIKHNISKSEGNPIVHKLRNTFERILYNESIAFHHDMDLYLKDLRNRDQLITIRIEEEINLLDADRIFKSYY